MDCVLKLKELIKENMSNGQKQYKWGLTWGPAKAMKVSRICLPYVELKKEKNSPIITTPYVELKKENSPFISLFLFFYF